MKKKLLINWLYYHPVGHVIEPLKLAKGYQLANKNLEVYLIINADSPRELPDACPWIKKTYTVSLDEVQRCGAGALQKIPKKWDYVITDNRARWLVSGRDNENLIHAQDLLKKLLVAKVKKGYVEQSGIQKESILPIVGNPKIKLPVPDKARDFAKKFKHRGPKIAILLGGSSGKNRSPGLKSWLRICQALVAAIPDLKIYFTGVSRSINGRTATRDFNREDVDDLINRLPGAEYAYDLGLWNQIALIETCDIFLSPHTGFAFIAPLVNTPWLEIATCPWPAYIFNDLPFYSVLPDCGSYPGWGNPLKGCGKLLQENKKARCVSDRSLKKKIPEIVRGARYLLDKKFTYKKAISLHLKKIRKNYPIQHFFFLGGIEGLTHTPGEPIPKNQS
ncbi:MAG TPA: hypothetical protein PKM27_11440 [Saprospiraceae bacterium]|nr:hypothetical protein [Saprospiraceae bacterium]HNT20323.1 hypothetical protein [Saprospiraceae bacterium]